MGWGEWCRRPAGKQSPRSGKVNGLNKTKFMLSTDFKLSRQTEIRQVIVIFKFLISVRVDAPGVKNLATPQEINLVLAIGMSVYADVFSLYGQLKSSIHET
jgi:hypothetical protein